MTREALFVRLRAKPGKEEEVETFLKGGLAVVQQEPRTPLWFALKFDPSTFAIFDAFADSSARDAHLAGRLAAQLTERAADLLAEPPAIEKADVLVSKAPA